MIMTKFKNSILSRSFQEVSSQQNKTRSTINNHHLMSNNEHDSWTLKDYNPYHVHKHSYSHDADHDAASNHHIATGIDLSRDDKLLTNHSGDPGRTSSSHSNTDSPINGHKSIELTNQSHHQHQQQSNHHHQQTAQQHSQSHHSTTASNTSHHHHTNNSHHHQSTHHHTVLHTSHHHHGNEHFGDPADQGHTSSTTKHISSASTLNNDQSHHHHHPHHHSHHHPMTNGYSVYASTNTENESSPATAATTTTVTDRDLLNSHSLVPSSGGFRSGLGSPSGQTSLSPSLSPKNIANVSATAYQSGSLSGQRNLWNNLSSSVGSVNLGSTSHQSTFESSFPAVDSPPSTLILPNLKKTKRQPQPMPENCKDEAYWERRKRNNESAKRSREMRRLKEHQTTMKVIFLEQENLRLKTEVNMLRNEVEKLREIVYVDRRDSVAANLTGTGSNTASNITGSANSSANGSGHNGQSGNSTEQCTTDPKII